MGNIAFSNRDACRFTALDFKTGKEVLNFKHALTTVLDGSGEVVYAYGENHAKQIGFTGERGGTFKFEAQLQTMQLYSFITGGTIDNTAEFLKREVITATEAKTLTLSNSPIAGSVNIFAYDDDCGTALPSTINDKVVTAEDIVIDKKYIAYYIESLTDVQKISITSSTFPGFFKIYAYTYEKTTDGTVIPYKLTLYKCMPQPNFSLSFSNSGDPATLSVTCDLLADDDNKMIDFILATE